MVSRYLVRVVVVGNAPEGSRHAAPHGPIKMDPRMEGGGLLAKNDASTLRERGRQQNLGQSLLTTTYIQGESFKKILSTLVP